MIVGTMPSEMSADMQVGQGVYGVLLVQVLDSRQDVLPVVYNEVLGGGERLDVEDADELTAFHDARSLVRWDLQDALLLAGPVHGVGDNQVPVVGGGVVRRSSGGASSDRNPRLAVVGEARVEIWAVTVLVLVLVLIDIAARVVTLRMLLVNLAVRHLLLGGSVGVLVNRHVGHSFGQSARHVGEGEGGAFVS
ncbi:hypothetical protein PG988_006140 [Apiospora saccharicola]